MKPIDLQTILQDSILTAEPQILPYLCSPPRGCVEDRFAIYAHGFYARLAEVLASDYTTLASLIGENKFSQICQDYIQTYPSYSYSLNFLGQNLPQFLIHTQPYNKKIYLAEIAAFEWAESQSITAADAKILSVSDLQLLPPSQWPEHIFYLHPSCQILTMKWNSLSLIKAARNNAPIPRPRKLKTPQSVIVWRHQREVRYCKLKRSELTMLTAIQQQASFMEICEQLCFDMPEENVANYLVQELHGWLQEQLLIQPRARAC